MSLFDVINTSATGMVANRFWLDIIAGNIANASTTKTADGEPYRRKLPIFKEVLKNEFEEEMSLDSMVSATGEFIDPKTTQVQGKGVEATSVKKDLSPLTVVHSPGHPDANEEGYVEYPNVNIVKEMVDMISASKAYDANVQVTNAAKSMITKALEIGK